MNIADLAKQRITNEVKESSEGVERIYVGTAFHLSVSQYGLRGGGSLVSYRKEWTWLPFMNGQRKVKEWDISVCPVNSAFYIFNGATINYIDSIANYRGSLAFEAKKKNIDLPRDILEKVFAPIDEKIMELYRKLPNISRAGRV